MLAPGYVKERRTQHKTGSPISQSNFLILNHFLLREFFLNTNIHIAVLSVFFWFYTAPLCNIIYCQYVNLYLTENI